MNPCREFRRRLERALDARQRAPQDFTHLGWHEHLVSCTPCRELLEAEEALEMLLASLPDPRLPQDLAQRVLLRLVATRGDERLDHLLALDEDAEAPSGQAARIVSGVRNDQDQKLDRLLERAGVVDVPEGLAGRVLAGVAAQCAAQPATARLLVFPRRRLLRGAAALVLVAGSIGLWSLSRAGLDEEPPEGLLAALDVLENWDAIASDDLAVRTGIGFEQADEALLDFMDPADLGDLDGVGGTRR